MVKFEDRWNICLLFSFHWTFVTIQLRAFARVSYFSLTRSVLSTDDEHQFLVTDISNVKNLGEIFVNFFSLSFSLSQGIYI